ncbi:uncharacterized protein MKK02DRAFT_39966 [Dioszegia hungarica]|uniref:Uncharacterized protein n=1 Tax=Dioszegia hungarica TaxID=4972 RepID=A0AA38LY84_9TREE|nr:uncharacterized protein MKK02DRAFT_39966 [Dioszegia hungarica]KAI9639643.1 hypothetical protein MKK02DRAFT_39966 [Dioszegia hungarica]
MSFNTLHDTAASVIGWLDRYSNLAKPVTASTAAGISASGPWQPLRTADSVPFHNVRDHDDDFGTVEAGQSSHDAGEKIAASVDPADRFKRDKEAPSAALQARTQQTEGDEDGSGDDCKVSEDGWSGCTDEDSLLASGSVCSSPEDGASSSGGGAPCRRPSGPTDQSASRDQAQRRRPTSLLLVGNDAEGLGKITDSFRNLGGWLVETAPIETPVQVTGASVSDERRLD